MTRLYRQASLLLFILFCLSLPVSSQTNPASRPNQKYELPDDSEVVARVVFEYFDAFRNKNWARLDALVDDPKANYDAQVFADQLLSLRKLLEPLNIVSLETSLESGSFARNTPVAVVNMVVSIKALDPQSDSTVVDLVNTKRTLLLVKDKVRSWVIISDSPDPEGLADAILAAKTKTAIQCLLIGADLSTAANTLVEKGRGELRDGRLSEGLEALRVAMLVRNQADEARQLGYENRLEKLQRIRTPDKKELPPSLFLEIGNLHRDLRHYDLALEYLRKSLDWCKSNNNVQGMAKALLGIAKTYQEQGDYKAATDNYEKSYYEWTRAPKQEKVGSYTYLNNFDSIQKSIVNDLVNLFAIQGQPDSAADVFLESLKTLAFDTDSVQMIIRLYLTQGKIRQSLDFLENVSRYLTSLRDQQRKDTSLSDQQRKDNEVEVLSAQMIVLSGKYSSYLAQANFLQAEKQFIELDKVFKSLWEFANAEKETSTPEGEVGPSLEHASSLISFVGALLYGAEDQNNERFNLHLFNQSWSGASDIITNDTDITGELGETELFAVMIAPAGQLLAQKKYELALPYYLNVLQLGKLSDKPALIALADSRLAQVYFLQGNFDEALDHLEKSLAYCDTSGSTFLEKVFKNSLGYEDLQAMAKVHQSKGDYAKALEIYERVEAQPSRFAANFNDSIYLAIAELAYLKGDYQYAAKRANQFIDLGTKNSNHGLLWMAYDVAGQASAKLGQVSLAEKHFENAITEIEESRRLVVGGDETLRGFLENRITPYHNMVKLLIARGDVVRAFEYAERCKSRVLIDVLRGGRRELSKSVSSKELDTERTLRTNMITSNKAASRILQGTVSQKESSRLKSDQVNARLDYEVFRTKLYAAHPELTQTARPPEGITMDDAAKLLPSSDSALLQFLVTDEQTYLFVVTKDRSSNMSVPKDSHFPAGSLKVYSIDVKRDNLTEMVNDFRARVANPAGAIHGLAGRLHQLLLADALNDLNNKSTLLIAPDGILWELPFQALKCADRFLLQDFSISYVPSMTALREIQKSSATDLRSTGGARRKASGSAPNYQQTLLAIGNPSLGRATSDVNGTDSSGVGLSPLLETEKLAKRLATLWGQSQSRVYTGRNANETLIKKAIGNFKIIHLGAHGIFDDVDPMHSYIVLSQDEGKVGKSGSKDRIIPARSTIDEDGMLEAWELKDMKINARLTVLSACETALGRARIGEGMIGLSWGLFMAGSPTVVVSQWKVDAESTNDLMFDFHTNLKNNTRHGDHELRTAESLRSAALKLMQTDKFRHPYYWAGFVVIGVGS